MEIIYSTGKHTGATSKSPSISTNEGPPQRRVTIRATIVQQPDSTYPIVVKPYKLYASRAGKVEIDEAKFDITNVSDADLSATVVSQPPGYFTINLPADIKPGQTAQASLKIDPDHLEEAFEKSITLELNDDAHSRFTIPVIRRLIGAEAIPKTQAAPAPTGSGH